MKTFCLPDLGEGLVDAEIVEWHVASGDEVSPGATIVTVETDKAEVEVTSPWAGRVAELIAAAGDWVAVGAPLLAFEDGEADDGKPIVGELPETPVVPTSVLPRTARQPAGAAVRAAPAVRAYARKLGVALAGRVGTGPDGVITRADVDQAASGAGYEPLRRVRRAMARNMARAGREVVAATVQEEADVEPWCDHGDVMVRLLRGLAVACAAEPALNAWLARDGSARRLHEQIDCGVAVETDDGLFVPVLRRVGTRSPALLRDELDALIEKVRTRSAAPEDLHGATITLSNFGTVGGRFASLVVVPPQVAIVGAGRIAARACAREDAVEVRRMLPLSLSFDHRAVTGVEATRFLVALIADLERSE